MAENEDSFTGIVSLNIKTNAGIQQVPTLDYVNYIATGGSIDTETFLTKAEAQKLYAPSETTNANVTTSIKRLNDDAPGLQLAATYMTAPDVTTFSSKNSFDVLQNMIKMSSMNRITNHNSVLTLSDGNFNIQNNGSFVNTRDTSAISMSSSHISLITQEYEKGDILNGFDTLIGSNELRLTKDSLTLNESPILTQDNFTNIMGDIGGGDLTNYYTKEEVDNNFLPTPGTANPLQDDYILTYDSNSNKVKRNHTIKDSNSYSSGPIISGSDTQIPTTKTMVKYTGDNYYNKSEVNNLLKDINPSLPDNIAVIIDLTSATIQAAQVNEGGEE